MLLGAINCVFADIRQDTQSRIRQGLKENLRTSNDQYEDHLKGTLNKLRKSYWSKCQAVEVSCYQRLGENRIRREVLTENRSTSGKRTQLRCRLNCSRNPLRRIKDPSTSSEHSTSHHPPHPHHYLPCPIRLSPNHLPHLPVRKEAADPLRNPVDYAPAPHPIRTDRITARKRCLTI